MVDVLHNHKDEIVAMDWCFLHKIDTVAALRKLVEFYVKAHNESVPHSAFKGQTPDEMYFGRGDSMPEELAEMRKAARMARIEKNRSQACSSCHQLAAAA